MGNQSHKSVKKLTVSKGFELAISTDSIVIIAFLIFFFAGWAKGFLRSILGPISLIIGSIISVQYYYQKQDILMALVIGIVGPFAINIIGSILLKIWHLTVDEKKELSPLSRIIGGCFSLFWRGTLFILTLILITFIPGEFPHLDKVQENITASRTYSFIAKQFGNLSEDGSVNIMNLTELFNDPKRREKLQETESFQDLVEDQTFKELFSDEEFLKLAEEQNIGKLITHPNTQKILQDKNLLEKLMAFQKQLIEEGFQEVELNK